jgi:hypothetical protein
VPERALQQEPRNMQQRPADVCGVCGAQTSPTPRPRSFSPSHGRALPLTRPLTSVGTVETDAADEWSSDTSEDQTPGMHHPPISAITYITDIGRPDETARLAKALVHFHPPVFALTSSHLTPIFPSRRRLHTLPVPNAAGAHEEGGAQEGAVQAIAAPGEAMELEEGGTPPTWAVRELGGDVPGARQAFALCAPPGALVLFGGR